MGEQVTLNKSILTFLSKALDSFFYIPQRIPFHVGHYLSEPFPAASANSLEYRISLKCN